ncbi:hypothetical protein MTCT_0247 [Methanothermobacter sp. CaT2]|nr:hypothetical protein MTCT_0247 [Methanothermobacter sp. CaT2]
MRKRDIARHMRKKIPTVQQHAEISFASSGTGIHTHPHLLIFLGNWRFMKPSDFIVLRLSNF